MDDATMPGCPFGIQYRGSQPMREIVVDQSTARRLEELCSEMTDTCGLIEAILQLAVEDKSEKRAAYIKTALALSARGARTRSNSQFCNGPQPYCYKRTYAFSRKWSDAPS